MGEKKAKRITIYIKNEEEYNRLRAKLILAGKSVSAWFREMIEKMVAEGGENE